MGDTVAAESELVWVRGPARATKFSFVVVDAAVADVLVLEVERNRDVVWIHKVVVVVVICFVVAAGLRANARSVMFGVVVVVLVLVVVKVLSTAIVLVLVVVAFFTGNKYVVSRCVRSIRGGTTSLS